MGDEELYRAEEQMDSLAYRRQQRETRQRGALNHIHQCGKTSQ